MARISARSSVHGAAEWDHEHERAKARCRAPPGGVNAEEVEVIGLAGEPKRLRRGRSGVVRRLGHALLASIGIAIALPGTAPADSGSRPRSAAAGEAVHGKQLINTHVLPAEWRAAATLLPPGTISDELLSEAIARYDAALMELARQAVQLSGGRPPLALLAEAMQGEDAMTRQSARDLLDRMERGIWPNADRLLEATWAEISAACGVECEQERNRGRALVRRAAFLRTMSAGAAWQSAGEGTDLRRLVDEVEEGLRGARTSGVFEIDPPPAAPEDPELPWNLPDDLRAELDAELLQYEQFVDGSLDSIIGQERKSVVEAIEAIPGPEGFAEMAQAKWRRWDAIRRAQRAAAGRMGGILRSSLGAEAEAAWLDAYEQRTARHLFNGEELPSRLFQWIVIRVDDDAIVGECRDLYRVYIDRRKPIRTASIDALLAAKAKSPFPRRGVVEGAERDRLDGLLRERQSLVEEVLAGMRATLPESLHADFDSHVREVRRTMDPARPWSHV